VSNGDATCENFALRFALLKSWGAATRIHTLVVRVEDVLLACVATGAVSAKSAMDWIQNGGTLRASDSEYKCGASRILVANKSMTRALHIIGTDELLAMTRKSPSFSRAVPLSSALKGYRSVTLGKVGVTDTIASLWEQNALNVPLSEALGSSSRKQRKVSLPLYPFAKTRCWVGDEEVVNVSLISRPLPHKIKVLAMHGWRTNKDVLMLQTASLRKQLGDRFEFHFLEGPRISQLASDELTGAIFQPPFYEWWREEVRSENGDIFYDFENGIFESFEKVVDFMQTNGPFEILLGFSQGGTFASILTAMQLQRKLADQNSKVLASLPPTTVSMWRGVVNLCAVEPQGIQIPNWSKHSLDIPSLHVVGKQDDHRQSGLRLADTFVDAHIIEHEAGHTLPQTTEINSRIARKIKEMLGIS